MGKRIDKTAAKTAEDRAFMQGFAVALGIIQSGWRESGLVEMAVKEGGFVYEDFVKAKVDPYDLRLLRAAGVKKRAK